MSQESLRALLAQVHKRLEKTGLDDQDARAMLSTVLRDIERTLHRGTPDHAAQAIAAPKVEALAVQLEADHPALVQVLRELVVLLGGAGI